MEVPFNVEDALVQFYRDQSSDRIRTALAQGHLSLDARTVALKELARRGEPAPELPPGFAEGDPEGGQARSIWVWLLIFMVAFGAMCLFGTSAHNRDDSGFLWGVIFLQALVLTGCIAGLASFARSSSVTGVMGRVVMLLVLGVLIVGLSMCASFVRSGWLGG